MEQENISNTLSGRGVHGDDLLNVLDVVDEIRRVGGAIDEDGYAILFHATSKDNAEKIIQEQKMFGKEDGLFFSTKPDGQIEGYGNAVVTVRIPLEQLHLDDDFGDELHFRVEVPIRKKVQVIAFQHQ